MKVYYARVTSEDGGTHYVLDTVKQDVFRVCGELIDSGEYWCEEGDVIIEHQYFSLTRAGVLAAIQLGTDLGGNCDAILWEARQLRNQITEKENLLALHNAKIIKLEQELEIEKGLQTQIQGDTL